RTSTSCSLPAGRRISSPSNTRHWTHVVRSRISRRAPRGSRSSKLPLARWPRWLRRERTRSCAGAGRPSPLIGTEPCVCDKRLSQSDAPHQVCVARFAAQRRVARIEMEIDQAGRAGLKRAFQAGKGAVCVAEGRVAHGEDLGADIVLPRFFIEATH